MQHSLINLLSISFTQNSPRTEEYAIAYYLYQNIIPWPPSQFRSSKAHFFLKRLACRCVEFLSWNLGRFEEDFQ